MRLVGVVDADVAKADAVAREFGCRGFGSIEQLLSTHSEVQAASVAVPTVHHLQVAGALMEAGVDVLIEKPLATSLAEADELIATGSASRPHWTGGSFGTFQFRGAGHAAAAHPAHVF